MLNIYKEFFDKINLLDRSELIRIRTNEIYKENIKITKLKAFEQSNYEFQQGNISTKVLVSMLEMEYSRYGLTDLALNLSRELDKRIIKEQRRINIRFKKIDTGYRGIS